MDFTTETHGNVTVVALEGNLMGGPDASSLNNKLHELQAAGKNTIVLDLSKVQFINSSGLGILIGGASMLKTAGGALKLACASDKILAIIKITKLEKVFETYRTVSDAIASMRK
jgi:anti-sigma B factor antagonist